jgi:hypothetical protein
MSTAHDDQTELDRQWEKLLRGDVPPMIARSLEAFRRDLPELLETQRSHSP